MSKGEKRAALAVAALLLWLWLRRKPVEAVSSTIRFAGEEDATGQHTPITPVEGYRGTPPTGTPIWNDTPSGKPSEIVTEDGDVMIY